MRLKQLLFVLVLLAMFGAATAGASQLYVSVLGQDHATTVRLRAAGGFTHNEYRPSDDLLLVDLVGVTAGKLREQAHVLQMPGLKQYRVIEYTGAGGVQISRVELTLYAKPSVHIRQNGDELAVELAGAPPLAAESKPAVAVSQPKPAAASPVPAVFKRSSPALLKASLPVGKSSQGADKSGPILLRNLTVTGDSSNLEVAILVSAPVRPRTMVLAAPDRLVLDFPGTVPAAHPRPLVVNSGDIRTVRMARYQLDPPVTRVVVDLAAPHTFDVVAGEGKVVLRIRPAAVASVAKAKPESRPNFPAMVSESKAGPNVKLPRAVPSFDAVAPVNGKAKPAVQAIAAEKSNPEVKAPAQMAQSAIPPTAKPAPVPEVRPANKPHNKAELKPAVHIAQAMTPTLRQVSASVPQSSPLAESSKPAPAAAAPQNKPEAKPTTPEATPTAAAPLLKSNLEPEYKGAERPPASEFVVVEPKMKRGLSTDAEPAPRLVAADNGAAATPALSAPLRSESAPAPAPQQNTPGPAVNLAAEQRQQSGQPAAPRKRYTGEPISVNLKDVDLRDFFRLIHEISGLNIVLDPSVKGSLTIVLDDVPWDQALDIVLKNNALDRQLEGNVLRIATVDNLRKEAEARRRQREAQALAVEKVTVTRFLSYAHAKDVVPTVKKLLSARGEIVPDVRTNALVISDIPSTIPAIDNLLAQLDRKTQQVEIEARVVAATRTFARDIGTQLAFGFGNNPTAIGGALAGSPITVAGTPSTLIQSSKGVIPLFTNLGAVNPTSGISFNNFGSQYRVDAILTMAEQRGLAKVLSRPRVITQNNVQAIVKQGQRVPTVTLGQLGGPATVQYVEAVLRLTVTPQITVDNTIFLNIDIENTTVDLTHSVQDNPLFNTEQATTQVLVTNGGTVVIGGVLQTQNSINIFQVPFVGNIPVLGNLFKRRNISTLTQELIFFITPRIVET